MDDSPDKEMKELMEEMADDLGYAADNGSENHPRKPLDSKYRIKIMVLCGGFILLVIVLVAMLFGGGSKVATESSIQPRLDQAEEKLARLEGILERISHLEKQEQSLQKLIETKDRSVQSLAKRVEKMSLELDKLRKNYPPVAEKGESSPAAQKTATSEAKKQYHVVSSGDSPYSIARKYGISVAELSRLNNLGPKQVIYPGQKLLVAQGSGQ